MSITEEHLRKLRWQCRRGMLELDQILLPFLEHHFATLSKIQQSQFEVLLTEPDQRLNALLMGVIEPEAALKDIVQTIRQTMQQVN